MKKTVALMLTMMVLVISACARATTTVPTLPAGDETMIPTETSVMMETETPLPDMTETSSPDVTETPGSTDPTATPGSTDGKQYTNADFQFGFSYPADWFGPDEYVSENVLRVAVGSDVVYPYGEVPETPSAVKNSYQVVVQYTKDNQNSELDPTYVTLSQMEDGEVQEGARNRLTRVREVTVGRFTGFEFTSTLSETAQTETFFMRQVLLVDNQTKDVISVMGQPNNVVVTDPATWRDLYAGIDEANLDAFHMIVESITAE